MEKKKYILLEDLEVYKLARELSKTGWEIYILLDWQTKKVMGDQFISAIDSVGANIAEGYGRFHYLDKIKFYYNARASLAEGVDHWLELLKERNKIDEQRYSALKENGIKLSIKLNNFISATYKSKNNES
ncbi:MAG: four helix bundle protein [Candidatus Doudnabacteria bacterium]|nr:four helix bundle protein [Candidatus Doudnabacteria bacterium]